MYAAGTGRSVTVTGTPAVADIYNVSVTATDSTGSTASQSFTLIINAAVSQPSGLLPNWTENEPYAPKEIATTGGTDSVDITVAGLPPGLSAAGTGRTRTVSGTPSATGTFIVTANVTRL
jgi:hypothetical protein